MLADQAGLDVYRPRSFSEYVAPRNLGSDPFSGIFEMQGRLYHLPLPIEQLSFAGRNIPESVWVAPGGREWFEATYEGEESLLYLQLFAHNIMEADEDPSLEGQVASALYCEATAIEFYTSRQEALLPGNIRLGMGADEFAAIGQSFGATVKWEDYSAYDSSFDTSCTLTKESDGQNVRIEAYISNGIVTYLTLYVY